MDHETSDLIDWFKKAAGTEKCTVELEGMKQKGDGYVADVMFATVTLDEPNQNGKQLHLVAKVSKKSKEIRKLTSDLCQREVLFYKDVVPIFQQFQQEKSLKEPFRAIPKCYKTFLTENTEVIIQENMKIKGYVLHNRKHPININHMKLALTNYAKFHAISLAIRDQKPDMFQKIEESFYDLFSTVIPKFEPIYEKGKIKVINNLNEMGRNDLAKRYEKLVERNIADILLDLLNDVPDEKVVVHGDCHNGNFLFEYKDENEESPSNMVFLDFQISFVFSPMIDLSLLLYLGSSKKEFAHFKELMEFYHNELSSFLSQLGSDVNKLFPISTMWKQWKRYSLFGFICASTFLEMLFIESEEAPDLVQENRPIEELVNVTLKDRGPYLERLVAVLEHYLNFNNIH